MHHVYTTVKHNRILINRCTNLARNNTKKADRDGLLLILR